MRRQPGPRALVLAAGRGERLRPLTLELPKPLLPVAGRPLVVRSLDALLLAGCREAALNLHHLGEAIRAALGESHRCGRRTLALTWSDESAALLGTGGALVPLAPFLAGASPAVVLNGDSLCRWPLDRLLARHARGDAAVTLLVACRADPRRFGGGVAVDRGRVVAFRGGDLAAATAPTRRVFAGAAVLHPSLLARLPAGASDIVSALYEPLLAEGATIAAVETFRPWHDLGTPARYLEGALDFALTGLAPRRSRVDRAARVAAGARVRSSMVEPGASVEAGARLARCLVLPDAVVGAGARLRRVIVGPGVHVAAHSDFSETLLTRGADGSIVATPLGS
ncbi:MAG: NTP transferase domain-containing protein [Thermoanaerobaculia bacterium]|nr:MAG: NTP transferase domain-containing protein [Thermoanaerobaculia bacterium]MBZ0102053.1 NTP transferase domain-containing protein [Thermoanaerobaculia bacterium]